MLYIKVILKLCTVGQCGVSVGSQVDNLNLILENHTVKEGMDFCKLDFNTHTNIHMYSCSIHECKKKPNYVVCFSALLNLLLLL